MIMKPVQCYAQPTSVESKVRLRSSKGLPVASHTPQIASDSRVLPLSCIPLHLIWYSVTSHHRNHTSPLHHFRKVNMFSGPSRYGSAQLISTGTYVVDKPRTPHDPPERHRSRHSPSRSRPKYSDPSRAQTKEQLCASWARGLPRKSILSPDSQYLAESFSGPVSPAGTLAGTTRKRKSIILYVRKSLIFS